MNDPRERLIKICISNLQKLNISDENHKQRLKKELQEIDSQQEHEYLLGLYDNKYKFSNNENNLLIAYLLGLCDNFNLNEEPKYIQGEFPDIDVDYLPIVQDYLRNTFCPKAFGRDNVVNIGNYGTFGMKSALLDMARVHGVDRIEIQTITKNLQDKDEEGNPLTWEKALEISPELSEYSKKYPEVTEAARKLIDRNRSRGKHAGGTVISSVKIADFVPVMIDTDGNPVSGWTEGLHDQDLQPVGLIKFDVLAIKDLLRIANCCKLIKERHNIKFISAKEGMSDWTDTSYLNDIKSISLANDAKTRGVFQFDSEGMRNLIKSGGVDSFDDLVAYTALFRPSALKMHERYIQRKKGKETWEDQVPNCVREVLRKTHGVLCYQEQCMQVLNIVGDIPLIHCEKIRKAISKKKISEFAKYKQMFLENGSKKTGWPIDSEDNKNINFLWSQLEAFSGYGFNKSHACSYTYISSRLLYLKSHYPLEFFVTTLSLESDEDKLRSYKREAERSGIRINKCDLNKSKSNFEIVGDEIYIGFSNIKGIGKEVADEIASKQPYNGIEDFLKRFGTDKRVVEPLIYLEVFKERPIPILLEFYEDYKKWSKSIFDRQKRQEKRRSELLSSVLSLLKEDCINKYDHGYLINLYENFDKFEECDLSPEFCKDDFYSSLRKYWKNVSSYEQKAELIEQNFISLENWESKNIHSIDSIPNQFDLEKKYYGFSWQHPLEKSPDYIGDNSFLKFKNDEDIINSGVECMVVNKPEEKTSKKGSKYYTVLVEDEDWNKEIVTFWQEDYNKFKEEIEYWDEEHKIGNLLQIRVTKPGPGFKSYTFESPSKRDRYKFTNLPKNEDVRFHVMKKPV